MLQSRVNIKTVNLTEPAQFGYANYIYIRSRLNYLYKFRTKSHRLLKRKITTQYTVDFNH